MEMQYIIYMQEACGPPHIDHYRSKLCSLYTSNDQLCSIKIKVIGIIYNNISTE